MSYINDALNKVQKEKESPYDSYGDIVSAEVDKPELGKKWSSVIGLLVIFLFAAGFVAFLYWPDVRETPRAVKLVPSPDILAAQPVQSTSPVNALHPPAPQPALSTEVAAPLPAKIAEATHSGKALTAEMKEKKQNAIRPDNKIKPEAPRLQALAETESLYVHALQKQREGRLEEARELYKKVIQKEPRRIQALNNLGVVHLKLKEYKWAIIRLNDALDIEHNYVDAHYNLACLYAQKNDTKQSLFYLKNAMDYNPEARIWAAKDEDLKNLADLPEFHKILQVWDE